MNRKWKLDEPMFYEDKKASDFNKKRYKKLKKQLNKNGWCDSETWSLDGTITEFILPRLRRLIEILKEERSCPGHFTSNEMNELSDKPVEKLTYEEFDTLNDKAHDIAVKKWHIILDEILEGFELHNEMYDWEMSEDKDEKMRKVQNGLNLFAKHYLNLWW